MKNWTKWTKKITGTGEYDDFDVPEGGEQLQTHSEPVREDKKKVTTSMDMSGTGEEDGASWKKFTKNLNIGKTYVLQKLGQAEKTDTPEELLKLHKQFKDIQKHYEEETKCVKKLVKNSSAVATTESTIGDSLSIFGTGLMAIDDLADIMTKFSECFKNIAAAREEMQSTIECSYLNKVHGLEEEGKAVVPIKEKYRDSKLLYDTALNKLNSLKAKPLQTDQDKQKIAKAEEELKECKQVMDEDYQAAVEEYEYQLEIRDVLYKESLKEVMLGYKRYFSVAAEMMNQITTELQPEKVEAPTRKKDKQQALVNSRKVFGVSLDEVLVRPNQEGDVPNIVQVCVKYLEEKGLKTEGLLRIPADVAEMQIMKKKFDSGEIMDIKNYEDAHVVAGLLKLYIRELPTPLFTYELYSKLLAVQDMDLPRSIEELKNLVSQLPRNNYTLINYLMKFLNKLASNSAENKMTPSNVAIVFGLNLLRPQHNDLVQLAKDTPKINKVCTLCVQYYNEIFTSSVTKAALQNQRAGSTQPPISMVTTNQKLPPQVPQRQAPLKPVSNSTPTVSMSPNITANNTAFANSTPKEKPALPPRKATSTPTMTSPSTFNPITPTTATTSNAPGRDWDIFGPPITPTTQNTTAQQSSNNYATKTTTTTNTTAFNASWDPFGDLPCDSSLPLGVPTHNNRPQPVHWKTNPYKVEGDDNWVADFEQFNSPKTQNFQNQ